MKRLLGLFIIVGFMAGAACSNAAVSNLLRLDALGHEERANPHLSDPEIEREIPVLEDEAELHDLAERSYGRSQGAMSLH